MTQIESPKCDEPIPSANNEPCDRELYKYWDEDKFYWMCPTHGMRLRESLEEQSHDTN